jgi:2',3'-cyclic-nucleotide 2'-phosphodiesterase (5'-nucleotidase family)
MRVFTTTLALVALSGCYVVTEQPQLAGQDVRLTVLHTSDIHARLLPYEQTPGLIDRGLGLCAELHPFGGVARMQHLLKRERAKAQRVMHLDSGDCFQGAPIFNLFKGEAEVRAMAEMNPDGVVLGNHEFDLGSRNVADQYERWGYTAYPLLAANYLWPDPTDPNNHKLGALVKPYEIINLDGLKIAIIGMGNTSSMTSISLGGNSLGVTPLEPLETVRMWVNALEPVVDLVFIVSHMGLASRTEINLAEDTEVITGYERVVPVDAVQPNWQVLGAEPNNQVRVKVPGVVGVDAIFGGHLHIVLNPPKILVDPAGRRVPLVHSGAFAKFVGRADFVVRMPAAGEVAPRGPEIVSNAYSVIPITNRVPKKSPSAVAACPEGGAPTTEVEEGNDNVSAETTCGQLFFAAQQESICQRADACRQRGDACTDECRVARRDCTSVPAPIDGRMTELLSPYEQQLYQANDLGKGFVYATSRIDRFGLSGEDSPLGNMVADSMRRRNRIEAQFSMTNSLGIRTNMEAGVVTIEQMFNIFPFENSLTTVFLSGIEVQELFDYVTERSAERGCQTQAQISGVDFTMHCAQAIKNNNAPECQSNADCQTEQALAWAAGGTKHTARCQEDRCFKSPADDIRINGEVLNPTESYKVAVNDFIGRGGSGFEVLRRNTTKIETTLSLRDALIDYMRAPPEDGGPGRVCGSPFMIEPIKRPPAPHAVIDKKTSPNATCETRPTGCNERTGRFVDCVENGDLLEFYCVPYDFTDPTPSQVNSGDECLAISELAPLFESRLRPGTTPDRAVGCNATLSRACPGQLHCCERKSGDNELTADFYCVVPYCVDPPQTGRITRIVQ